MLKINKYIYKMVTHICEKCDRVFSKKSSYQVHVNRKFPCAPEGNRIDKLEEKNKILEKKVEDLTKLVEQLLLKNNQFK